MRLRIYFFIYFENNKKIEVKLCSHGSFIEMKCPLEERNISESAL